MECNTPAEWVWTVQRKKQVVQTILELAACGIWDINEHQLNGLVDLPHISFNNIPEPMNCSDDNANGENNKSGYCPTGVVAVHVHTKLLPPWANNIQDSNDIAIAGIIEFIISNYKKFSQYEHRSDDEVFKNVLWYEVKSAINVTTLESPLMTKGWNNSKLFIRKEELLDTFKYFDYCNGQNPNAWNHRNSFTNIIENLKLQYLSALPTFLSATYNDGTIFDWHIEATTQRRYQ